MFIIRCVPQNNYFSIDLQSGGYPYWGHLQSAQIFKTKEEAERIVNSDDFTTPNVMSDGTVFPPTMLQSAAQVSYTKPENTTTIQICELEFKVISSREHKVVCPTKWK